MFPMEVEREMFILYIFQDDHEDDVDYLIDVLQQNTDEQCVLFDHGISSQTTPINDIINTNNDIF